MIFIRYKAEGVPAGETMQGFCSRNKVPYNIFLKWYKDTHRKVVPVQVDGLPQEQEAEPACEAEAAALSREEGAPAPSPHAGLRIAVDIRVSNGLQVRQRNLSPDELRRLVENLGALC